MPYQTTTTIIASALYMHRGKSTRTNHFAAGYVRDAFTNGGIKKCVCDFDG